MRNLFRILLMLIIGIAGCAKNETNTTAFVCGTSTITDIDGNTYHTVSIGSQCWMVENLKTGKYTDGASIPNVTDNTLWAGLTSGARCSYNNDAANNTTYGKLYNWYAIGTDKLAPAGWHVPTEADWTELTTLLGGDAVAAGKMKSTSSLWTPTNTGADNSSGFSGLPGGERSGTTGTFAGIGNKADFWTATLHDPDNANNIYFHGSLIQISRDWYTKQWGFSVRCVKD